MLFGMVFLVSLRKKNGLPARLNDAWDHSRISQLAEAEARQLKFLQDSAGAASHLAAASQTHWRGIARHFVQRHFGVMSLIFALIHVEDDRFELLTLFKLKFNEAFAPFLLCNRRFCCHVFSLLFASRTFLSLLAVRIIFVNHVDASFPAYNLVALGRIGFNRCFDFHNSLLEK